MKKEGIAIVFFMLLLGLASAAYEIGNKSYSLDGEYAPNDYIRGWINISFEGESINSMFEDSFDNNATLKDLLAESPQYDYSCSTKDCQSDFSLDGTGGETMTFALGSNGEKNVGFFLTDDIDSIDSIKFTVQSNAASSCYNQLKVDFLADGTYEVGNNKSTTQVCGSSPKNYSCYNPTESSQSALISNIPYCQKITLPEAPGFRVGAWIKKNEDVDADILMRLFEVNRTKVLGDCKLNVPYGGDGEFACDIDFLVTKPKEFYLCIFADTNDSGIYQTKKATSPTTKCGFYGVPKTTNTMQGAYYIFMQPLTFTSFGEVAIQSKFPNGTEITPTVENYIKNKYGSMDCSDKGCVIPVKFKSSTEQQVTVKDLSVVYTSDSGPTETKDFYNIKETPAKVTADFQKLDLDGGRFTVPDDLDEYDYELEFKGDTIIEDNITVGNVPIINNVFPKTAALGYNTRFTAEVDAMGGNITKYIWTFDNTPKTTYNNNVYYTFGSLGEHNVTVKVEDSRGKSSTKKFNIKVDTPEVQIERDIERLKENINSLEEELGGYTAYEKDRLEEALDLNTSKALLADVEENFENATNESEFLEILNELFSINVPSLLSATDSGDNLIFFPAKENIDLSAVENISTKEYDYENAEAYKNAILGWQQKHYDVRLKYKKVSAISETGPDHLITFYTIDVNEKTAPESIPYLFISKMNDLEFKSDYDEEELDFYYLIDLDEEGNSFSFTTTEDLSFEYLPAFLSPALEDLNIIVQECVSDDECNEGEICNELGKCIEEDSSNKWTFFALAMVLLVIVAFIVYIILFQWYKNKYETHLFKNRNNLFNLVTYINNQKKKGVSDDEIEKKLKKAKWSSEQITYAMKKYYGKNTGMFALPFLKVIFGKENRKRKLPPRRPSIGLNRNYPGQKRFG